MQKVRLAFRVALPKLQLAHPGCYFLEPIWDRAPPQTVEIGRPTERNLWEAANIWCIPSKAAAENDEFATAKKLRFSPPASKASVTARTAWKLEKSEIRSHEIFVIWNKNELRNKNVLVTYITVAIWNRNQLVPHLFWESDLRCFMFLSSRDCSSSPRKKGALHRSPFGIEDWNCGDRRFKLQEEIFKSQFSKKPEDLICMCNISFAKFSLSLSLSLSLSEVNVDFQHTHTHTHTPT